MKSCFPCLLVGFCYVRIKLDVQKKKEIWRKKYIRKGPKEPSKPAGIYSGIQFQNPNHPIHLTTCSFRHCHSSRTFQVSRNATLFTQMLYFISYTCGGHLTMQHEYWWFDTSYSTKNVKIFLLKNWLGKFSTPKTYQCYTLDSKDISI